MKKRSIIFHPILKTYILLLLLLLYVLPLFYGHLLLLTKRMKKNEYLNEFFPSRSKQNFPLSLKQ